jgi:phosphomethylpyrimidine synthase
MAKTTRIAHPFPMKITEDDPSRGRWTAEQGIAEEEALKRGMEEKSRKFPGKGGELYAKA